MVEKKQRRKKQEVRTKELFTPKNEAEVKNGRGNFRKGPKKIIFRRYGEEGNKLRRRKSRQMRSRTKEVKKKTR